MPLPCAGLALAVATRSEQGETRATVAEGAERAEVRRVRVGGAHTQHPFHIGWRLHRAAFVAGRRNNPETGFVR